MPFYKLPPAGFEQQSVPPPGQDAAYQPAAAASADTRQRTRRGLFAEGLVPGLLRLLLRAVAVRAAASGRLVDEQEERQLRLLRISSPASGSGR